MPESEYTIGEVAREVQRAASQMAALAARLEGGQFVQTALFNTWKEGLEIRLNAMSVATAGKVDASKFEALQAEVDSLKDDRKWLVRALVFFILTTVLGVVFAASGGVLPK